MLKHRSAWAVAVAFLASSHAQAATFNVNSTADAVDTTPGDGVCATAGGACTLRAAIQETNALLGEDTIELPAGHYTLAIPGAEEDAAVTGDLDVTDDLTLVGAGAEATIIDANGIDRVLHVDSGAALSVDSLTVTGGAARRGGGILCAFCRQLSVTNSAIRGNVANAVFGEGGGIRLDGVQAATIAFTRIEENHADLGAGVSLEHGDLTIRESAVSGNVAFENGMGAGAILTGGGRVKLLNSTVSGNAGVGVWNGSCYQCFGSLTIQSSTVSDNDEGGIYNGSGYVTLKGSVVAEQSSGPDCYNNDYPSIVISSGGYNLDSDGSCNLRRLTDLPDNDPFLGPLQDNGGPTLTHALLPGSPAMDAIPVVDCTYDDDGDPGTSEVPLATDQRDVPRPQGLACDIGAYELIPGEPTPPPTPTPTPTATPTPTPLPVGDIQMCKFKRGKQVTVLVPPSKLQRSLDKGLTMGECPDAINGVVMCQSKRGKMRSMVVPLSKVQRSLDKGMTLGVCRGM